MTTDNPASKSTMKRVAAINSSAIDSKSIGEIAPGVEPVAWMSPKGDVLKSGTDIRFDGTNTHGWTPLYPFDEDLTTAHVVAEVLREKERETFLKLVDAIAMLREIAADDDGQHYLGADMHKRITALGQPDRAAMGDQDG